MAELTDDVGDKDGKVGIGKVPDIKIRDYKFSVESPGVGLKPLQIDILRTENTFGVDFRIYQKTCDGKHLYLAEPPMMSKFIPDGQRIQPTIHLEPEALQDLADSLGSMGIYPRNLSDRVTTLERDVKELKKGKSDE